MLNLEFELNFPRLEMGSRGKYHLVWQDGFKAWPKGQEYLNGNEYSIDEKYLDEIHRNALQAQIEWSHHRPFDTVIREAALKPAIAHVETAFMLLADSLWDSKEKRFDRGMKRCVLKQALLVRFWINQTGIGLVWDHADMSNLERMVELQKETDTALFNPAEITYTETFIKDVRKILTWYHSRPVGYDIPGSSTD